VPNQMRFIEYIVKSGAVWVALWMALALTVRIPISFGWMSETDQLALVVIGGSLVFSLVLTAFAVLAQRRLASYAVLWIVGGMRAALVVIVLIYPIFLAWNLHGFLGAAGAFFLPVICQAWAVYVNMRDGAYGFAMLIGVLIVSTFIYDWCRFKIPDRHDPSA
jgi:hypothetical protein